MTTNGITQIEMETMHAIIEISNSLNEIKENLATIIGSKELINELKSFREIIDFCKEEIKRRESACASKEME